MGMPSANDVGSSGRGGRVVGRMAALLAVLLVAACGGGPSMVSGSGGKEVVMAAETFSFGKLQFESFADYRIRAGDQLDVMFQIETWKDRGPYRIAKDDVLAIKFPNAPELNETQPVRPDGHISLAYLGEVAVEGKTVGELTDQLKASYSTILKQPEVYVTVPTFLAQIRDLKQDLRSDTRGAGRVVTVRPDGVATFPLVGHMPVVGRSIEDVNVELNRRYTDINPSLRVDLFLEQHADALVYVLGEVANPGGYNLTRPVTALEAMALAGGYTTDAKLAQVVVVRRSGDQVVGRQIDLNDPLSLASDARLFYVMPDDLIYVPRTEIASVAQLVTQLSEIVNFRGWSVGMSWELHKIKQ